MAIKLMLLSHLPVRDELPDTLFAHSLASEDVLVWKYPILADCRSAICLIKPDIVIVPEVRLEFTRDLVKNLKEWGVKVVQKRCEMGISSDTKAKNDLKNCILGNVEWWPYIDIDLVWGQDFANMLIKYGVPEDKIKVIGSINIDPYFVAQPSRTEHNQKRILFAGGFGYADSNPLYAAPEAKPGEKIHIDLVKNDRENRVIFQTMMGEIMKKFPQYEYGIRGHPGEIATEYLQVYPTLKNIEGCITPLAIEWADIIIHTGSTMAFESHLLNKPTFNFKNTSMDKVIGQIAPIANNIEELVKYLESVELGKSNANLKIIERLEQYYGPIDGKACERAKKVIMETPIRKTNIPNEWPKDEIKYPNDGVYTNLFEWNCNTCKNKFHAQASRTQIKCPYCGIANVQRRFLVHKTLDGEEKWTQVQN